MNPANNTTVAFGITSANDNPSPSSISSTNSKPTIELFPEDSSQYRVYQSGTLTPPNDSSSSSTASASNNKAKLDTSTYDTSVQYRVYQSGTLTPAAETTAQKNALRMAKDYLAYSAFSYKSLVAQLEYEKFSHDDAVYALDNCGANWNEQATKCAKQYLDYSAFSRDSLIEQLEYEGFTHDQAIYGVEQNGY